MHLIPRVDTKPYRLSDRVMAAYLLIEIGLILFATPRLAGWAGYLLAHALMLAVMGWLVHHAARSGNRGLHLFRDWYPVLYIPLIFKQLGALIPAVHPKTYDDLLLSWDETLLGGHPGQWLDGLASPLLTEVLRACWLSYFLLPFLVVIPLYLKKDRGGFHETVSVLVTGWLVSFLGYYVLPALGPGYFPGAIPAPGCVNDAGITRTLALALFSLEGKMYDIFPSGHTIIALIALWQARKYRLWFWPFLIPVVGGLIVGTVYLRYHYGVDVLAGVLIAALLIGLESRGSRVPV